MPTVQRTITIASGQTASGALSFNDLRHISHLVIYPPDTLDVTTFTVEVSGVRGTPVWKDLDDGTGTAVVLTAGEAIRISDVAFAGLRILAGAAVAADRVFTVVGMEFC